MPLYELLCLARPALAREDLARTIERVCTLVLDSGGVLTNLKSYGDQHLAYDIRKPHGRYSQAHVWQLDMMVDPATLQAVNHELRINADILRWVSVKKRGIPALPNGRTLFWGHQQYGDLLRPPRLKAITPTVVRAE